MKTMNKVIPRTFEATKKWEENITLNDAKEGYILFFEPSDGEMCEVVHWQRYPTYDIIYARPVPESKRYERESAFMCIRYENGKSYGHYLDLQEIKDAIEALTIIYDEKSKK